MSEDSLRFGLRRGALGSARLPKAFAVVLGVFLLSFALSDTSNADNLGFNTPTAVAVPEPNALLLFAAGVAGLLARSRRRAAYWPQSLVFDKGGYLYVYETESVHRAAGLVAVAATGGFHGAMVGGRNATAVSSPYMVLRYRLGA